MSRDASLLHPFAQLKAAELLTACSKKGLHIMITDCRRTKEEQDALYAQGRTAPGSIVTQVSYPHSMHNWGIAFDFCRRDPVNGSRYYNNDGFFQKVGEVGKSLGLEFGGDWDDFVDLCHFQLSGFGSTPKNLIATFGTPEIFISTWLDPSQEAADNRREVTVKLPTLERGAEGSAVKVWQAIIGAEVDGIWGKETDALTLDFQKKAFPDQPEEWDKVLGPKTWKAGLESVS